CSLLPAPCSLLPAPCSLLPAPFKPKYYVLNYTSVPITHKLIADS
ncbi:MAG: hypothetical protein F6K56_45150, partial [Moorea sp. SIO3G5]|nr:hypothetical protein [Moorena sp. SIO3G5]